jgi:hypothetical protein
MVFIAKATLEARMPARIPRHGFSWIGKEEQTGPAGDDVVSLQIGDNPLSSVFPNGTP